MSDSSKIFNPLTKRYVKDTPKNQKEIKKIIKLQAQLKELKEKSNKKEAEKKEKQKQYRKDNVKTSYSMVLLSEYSDAQYKEYMDMVGGRTLTKSQKKKREKEFVEMNGKRYMKLQKVNMISKRKIKKKFVSSSDDIINRYAIPEQRQTIVNVYHDVDYETAPVDAFMFEKETVIGNTPIVDVQYHNSSHVLPSSKWVQSRRQPEGSDKLVKSPVNKVGEYSCCYDIFIHYFKEPIEKYWNTQKKNKGKLLDLKFLLSITGKDSEDLGLTLSEYSLIFKEFKKFLTVHDTKGAILFDYQPETESRAMGGKRGIHLIAYNGHLVPVTNNLKELEQKDWKLGEDKLKTPSAFITFKESDPEEEEARKFIIKKADDDVELLKILFTIKRSVRIIYNGDMIEAILLLIKMGIHPSIFGTTIQVKSCSIIFNEIDSDTEQEYTIRIVIQSLETFSGISEDTLTNATDEDILKFQEISTKFEKMLFQKQYCSDRSDDMKLLDKFTPKPLSNMSLGNKLMNEYLIGIDRNKSYASMLSRDVPSIGVFTLFDSLEIIPENFSKEDIISTAFYICEFTDEKLCDEDLAISYNSYWDEENSKEIVETHTFVTVGSSLSNYLGNTQSPLKVLQVLKPMKSVRNPLCEELKNLFEKENDLPMGLKKPIGNILIGKTRNITKKNRRVLLDTDYNLVKETIDAVRNNNNKIIEPINLNDEKNPLWFACEEVERELNNGFNYISNVIYMIQRHHLWDMQRWLNKRGIQPRGIKTDCVMFEENLLTEAQRKELNRVCNAEKFGGIKFEKEKWVDSSKNWNLSLDEIKKQKSKFGVCLDDIEVSDDDEEIMEEE